MSKPVLGTGSLNSKIAIVGEAPGAQEAAFGKPFIGPAGKLLDALLPKAGIVRSACYIDNVVQVKPPGNDITAFLDLSKKVVVKTKEYEDGVESLRHTLHECSANVIIALGNTSLYALTGKSGITKWRGSILESSLLSGRKVIPTIHPAAALREYLLQRIIVHDLIRAAKESEFPEIRRPQYSIDIFPSFENSVGYLHSLISNPTPVAVDIEVLGGEVKCIAFSNRSDHAFCIPFTSQGRDYFDPHQEAEIWTLIARLIESPITPKIFQNGMFDLTFMYERYGMIPANIDDTMIAHAILFPDYKHGLDFLTSTYTDHPYYKDEGKQWNKLFIDEKSFFEYNGRDSLVCFEMMPKLLSELEKKDNLETYRRQMALTQPMMYMQSRGILLDTEGMERKKQVLTKEVEELKEELHKVAGEPLNPQSPKQVQTYFYVKKGYPPYKSKGRITCDEMALKRLERKGSIEAGIINKIRKREKLKGTYLDVALDDDNRLRGSFRLITANGRVSSSKNIFGKGCVPPETKVLTKTGWRAINEIQNGESVLQWGNSKLSWTPAKVVAYKHEDKVIKVNSRYHKQLYTPEHRVPTISSKKHLNVKQARELKELAFIETPVSGKLEGYTDIKYLKLIVALQADGSFDESGARFCLKKPRKVARLLQILKEYDIPYTEQKAPTGYRRIRIAKRYSDVVKSYIGIYKFYGAWLLDLSLQQKQEFVEEVKYWDSTIRGKSYIYYTTQKSNAEWVQTLTHLVGYSSIIRINEDNNQGYGKGENLPLYSVSIKPRATASTPNHSITTEDYKGEVFCLTTETGFFLCKYQGVIVVTGNSNMQNQPPEMLEFMVADEGMLFVHIDLSQAENRIVARMAPEPAMCKAFDEGKDVHALTGALISGLSVEEVIEQHRNDISCGLGTGDKTWRGIGKTCNHALNYGLGYKTFALRYEFQEAEAKRLVEAYHSAYPGIRFGYHSYIQHQLQQNRTLQNLYGRKRTFLDRWGDELFKEAYAYTPQSSVADKMWEHCIIPVYNDQDNYSEVSLSNNTHDAIDFQIPLNLSRERQATLINSVVSMLEIPMEWKATEIHIPCDVSIGTNLGHMQKLKHSYKEEITPEIVEESLSKTMEEYKC